MIKSTISLASSTLTRFGEEIVTRATPSLSSTLISVPVSAWSWLMTLPFGPITSPTLSEGISKVRILGAFSRTSSLGAARAVSITCNTFKRASFACCSALASTCAGMPSILVSSCRAVTYSLVPATLKSMSP